MKLEGIHHITAITADAQDNVDFYAGVMGLRLVKKTVNQDQPTVYHLFFADEKGSAGSDLTFFEFPGVPPGRAGAGDVHRIVWRVASEPALDFWEKRLAVNGIESRRDGASLVFADPEGLEHELAVVEVADEPLIADHPEVPAEMALRGFHAARAYAAAPEASSGLLEALEFSPIDGGWEARGDSRGGLYVYDEPPAEPALQGAGSVHHIAWASTIDEHEEWRERAIAGGARPTPVIDRFYFRSIYFREPSGVLFEIATLGPGFTVDEPLEHLGEKLSPAARLRAHAARGRTEPAAGGQPAGLAAPDAERPSVISGGHSREGAGAEEAAPDFVWRDAGRTVLFDKGSPDAVPERLAEHGFDSYVVLHTARSATEAAAAMDAAEAAHEVPAGQVPELAARLLDATGGAGRLVAWGGGRVIDTAKAIAAVTGAAVAAIPTTLSGAEMTGIHRLPAGAEDRATGLVRPELVIAFPDAMTGLPEAGLRASAMNALAHGADCLYTPFANPVSRMTALRGAELIAAALDEEREDARPRMALALGAILCGYAIDSGMFALHHVICQTLVRVCGTPHAETNAGILPRAMAFMAPRAPEADRGARRRARHRAGDDRAADPRARRQPARPRRRRRRPHQARRGPGRDPRPPRAPVHPGTPESRRATPANRVSLVAI